MTPKPIEGVECMVCGDPVAEGDIVCPRHATMMNREDHPRPVLKVLEGGS